MQKTDLQKLETDLSPDKADAQNIAALIEKVEVTCQLGAEQATEWIHEIRNKANELAAKRASWVGPLNAVIADINRTFKAVLDPLEHAETVLKGSVLRWMDLAKAEHERLLASVGDAPESERETILASASAIEPQKLKGMSLRQTDEVVIEDEMRAFNWALENDASLLTLDKKAVARFEGQIPGVSRRKKSVLAVRGGAP